MEERENIFLGTMGAIAGAVVASILWVILGQIGFIAGIAGFLIVFCGVKGYQKLGKNMSRTGIIICIVISVIMIVAAEFVSTGIEIYRALKDDYIINIMESIKLVPSFLKEPEVRNQVIFNLLIGFALATWASFSFVKKLWNGTRNENIAQQGGAMINGVPVNNVQPNGTWMNNTPENNTQQGGMRINGVPVEGSENPVVTVPCGQQTEINNEQNITSNN